MVRDVTGTIRNKTEKYLELRRRYHGGDSSRADDRLGLLADAAVSTLGDSASHGQPVPGAEAVFAAQEYQPWIQEKASIQQKIHQIQEWEKKLRLVRGKTSLVSFDDNDTSTAEVARLTRQIQDALKECVRRVKQLDLYKGRDPEEVYIIDQVKQQLSKELHALSLDVRRDEFQHAQREMQLKNYDTSTMTRMMDEVTDASASSLRAQTLLTSELTAMVAERDQEIQQIVASIHELTQVMQDIGVLVHEQGTMLDRIDATIEQAEIHVEKAVLELEAASKHQKNSCLAICIMFLAVVVILMLLLILARKAFGF